MSRDPRALVAGDRLGRYAIVERLGQGVAATVYRATNLDNNRSVAVKVLHASASGDEVPVARLRREVLLMSRLQHPGLCRVHELDTANGLIFLAMEYVSGRTLESVLSVAGYLSARRATFIFRDVANALAVAHANDVIHRDLKPSNIMLRGDDSPVVLDFGLATGPGVTPLTAVGAWLGTFHYAAPEILHGARPAKASDVFSLGVTMYRSLTGVLPFVGDYIGHIAEAILRHGPKYPSTLVPAIPTALDAVVVQSLKLDPALRPADAVAFAAALDTVLTRSWPDSAPQSDETKVHAFWVNQPPEEPTAIFRRPTAPHASQVVENSVAQADPVLTEEGRVPATSAPADAPSASSAEPASATPDTPRNYVPPARGGFLAPRQGGASTRVTNKGRGRNV